MGAEAFLLNLCANKMPALGRTTIVHMLTPSGKMLAELTISRVDEDTFYVVTVSGTCLRPMGTRTHSHTHTVYCACRAPRWSAMTCAGSSSTCQRMAASPLRTSQRAQLC